MAICIPRPSSLAGPENGALIPRVMSVAVTPGAVAVSVGLTAGAGSVPVPSLDVFGALAAVPAPLSLFPPKTNHPPTPPAARISAAVTSSARHRPERGAPPGEAIAVTTGCDLATGAGAPPPAC